MGKTVRLSFLAIHIFPARVTDMTDDSFDKFKLEVTTVDEAERRFEVLNAKIDLMASSLLGVIKILEINSLLSGFNNEQLHEAVEHTTSELGVLLDLDNTLARADEAEAAKLAEQQEETTAELEDVQAYIQEYVDNHE